MLTELPTPTLTNALRVHATAWRWLLATVVTAAFVSAVAGTADLTQVQPGIERAFTRPVVTIAAAAAYAAAFALRALAWRGLFRRAPSLRELLANLHTGLFLNHLLPFKAGEISRPLLAVRHGAERNEAFATSVVARALDFACLAVIAGVLVPAAWGRGGIGLAVQAGAALTACGLGGVWWLRATSRTFPGASGRLLRPLSAGLREISLARITAVLPLVAASWALEGAMVWAAADLLGADIGLRVAVGATAVTILCQAVHVTPGGIGIYEAAMTAVLVSFGVSGETALGIALLTHGLKFAYALTVGGAFALGEGVFLLRGRAGTRKRASALEVFAARAWNVLNEGKPFTPVFCLSIIALLCASGFADVDGWSGAASGLLLMVPLALSFWRFDFPLRLRAALWIYLLAFVALTGSFWLAAAATVVVAYFGFTVVLWGTIYYHLRIGTPWSNGLRFVRLVCENPDPTSGNMLEQLPKVLLLVAAFGFVADAPSASSLGVTLAFSAMVAGSALLLHRWFFTWVPAPRQTAIELTAEAVVPRKSRRVIAIVIDGCRADRLLEANTPCIDRLRKDGADFSSMNTVYPARTVTCFSSMLTGAAPTTHGMGSNFVPSLGVKCESVFDVLRKGGMHGALVGIAHLIDAFGHRDVRTVTAVMDNDDIDDALIAEGKRVMREEDPELLVLQLLSVDQTGHARGSYNAEYLGKIEETDAKIEAFLGWCEASGYLEGATVMVTADHGQGIGIGGHGHMTPPEITIPCTLWGEGIERGGLDSEMRFITDIAPTICALLGLRAPASSVGRDLLATELPMAERPAVFVIPALNEAATLPAVIAAVRESGVANPHIVVVDDGSSDGTAAAARAAGAVVVSHEANRGLGAALRTGLGVARSMRPRAVVYLDADGEYDAREAPRLLAPIEAGEADYVLGARFGDGQPPGMTRARYVANRVFSAITSFLALRRVSDGQTGFRAFSARAADVAEIVHDYNYAQVLTLNLIHKGMRLREVPVSYRRREGGGSFVSGEYLWKVPFGMMREMLRG